MTAEPAGLSLPDQEPESEASDVAATRRTLLLTLGSMGASSAATGLALLATGHTSQRDRAFARQFVSWGAINVVIAGIGTLRERRRPSPDASPAAAAPAERAKLHRLLLVNSALDVGYIAGGAALMAAADRVGGRSGRYSAAMARGDGAGIMVQGGMLLALDVVFALRTLPKGQI